MGFISTKVIQELQSCLELLGFSSEVINSETMVINGNGLENVAFNYRKERALYQYKDYQDTDIDLSDDSFRIVLSKKIEGIGTITNRICRYGIGNTTIEDITDAAYNNVSIESIIEDKDGQKCHVRYEVSSAHYCVYCKLIDKNNNEEIHKISFRNKPSFMKRADGAISERESNCITLKKSNNDRRTIRLDFETLWNDKRKDEALYQTSSIKINDISMGTIKPVDFFAIKMGLMADPINVKLIKNVFDTLRLTYPKGEFDNYIVNSPIASLTDPAQVSFDMDNHFLYGDLSFIIYEYMQRLVGENVKSLDPVGHVKRLGVMQQ